MKSALLHTKFELNALTYPQHIALEYDQQTITYQALNEQSNQLANFLLEQGIPPGSIIAIYFVPGIQQILAILAILKAGCAYLPLDTEHPTERIEYMIQNGSVKTILSDSALILTNQANLTVFNLNLLKNTLDNYSIHSPDINIKNTDLAYIIYTSGSTGVPKGVLIEHGNVWNTLMQMGDIFPLTDTDKFLLNTSLGFDPSVWMVFWPLSTGGTVVLSAKEKDPLKICEHIIANQYRVFHAGPTLFRMLLSQAKFSECKNLQLIIGGGEAWKLADLQKMKSILPQLELCNVYGPTEASIHVTFWLSNKCDIKSLPAIPIGKALKNMQIFLLDEQLQPLPDGQIGDLYVAGAGVARGYINNPALTAEKFMLANIENQEVRLYKTGDLGKILPDGNLLFMGRADDQIKLRGYRIEPFEIETHILKTGWVNDVCVLGYLEEQTFSKLVAFIVAKNASPTIINKIKKQLRENLPEYMVPAFFIFIDKLPFTAHLKVDKKKLATLIPENIVQIKQDHPSPATEDLLHLWRETLVKDDFNEEDNFFDAGGDSLNALELISKINQKLGVELSVTSLFEYPTVSRFKKYLHENTFAPTAPVVKITHKNLISTLSDNQLWLYRMAKGSTSINNIVLPFVIHNALKVPAFEKAVLLLIEEQTLLRSNIEFSDFDNHKMTINEISKKYFYYHDITHLDETEQKYRLQFEYDALNKAKINLAADELFKISLLKCSTDRFYLYIYMNHLISDPATGQLIINKLIEFYDLIEKNKIFSLSSDNVMFFDYVEYEKQIKQSSSYQQQLLVWQDKLKNSYSLNFNQKLTEDLSGGSMEYTISQGLLKNTRSYIKTQGVTSFVFFLAIFKSCLYQLYKQSTFAIGINISKRNQPRWSTMLGPLSEQFLSIVDFEQVNTFEDLLKSTNDNIINIFNSALTIENIYRSIPENGKRGDLFNVLFDYEKVDVPVRNPILSITSLPILSNPEVRRYMTLRVIDNSDAMILKMRYRTKIFTVNDITRIFNTIVELLEKITTPEKRALVNY